MASIDNPVIWIHGDCLNPHNPAFKHHPNAPAIWVWDDAYLQQANISLKRILFIYECLLELPVAIHRGHVAEEITNFALARRSQHIVTMASPSPGFARIRRQLQDNGFNLRVYKPEPFVRLPKSVDLRRFSRYWRQAQGALK